MSVIQFFCVKFFFLHIIYSVGAIIICLVNGTS